MPYYDEYENTKPSESSPYRIIEIESNTLLSEFAATIVTVFEFDFDHAFGFYDNVKKYHNSKAGFVMKFDDESISFDRYDIYGDVDVATVGDMLIRKGKKWLFLFDYGDKWHFHVSLVGKVDRENETSYPRVVDTYMKAPLQYGYEEDDDDDDDDDDEQ